MVNGLNHEETILPLAARGCNVGGFRLTRVRGVPGAGEAVGFGVP